VRGAVIRRPKRIPLALGFATTVATVGLLLSQLSGPAYSQTPASRCPSPARRDDPQRCLERRTPFPLIVRFPSASSYAEATLEMELGEGAPILRSVRIEDLTRRLVYQMETASPQASPNQSRARTLRLRLAEAFTIAPPADVRRLSLTVSVTSITGERTTVEGIQIDIRR
jgi:hypothetical protein